MKIREYSSIPLYDDFTGSPGDLPFLIKPIQGHRVRPGRQLPHRHPYYELFWFHEGNGVFANDFGRYRLKAGSLGFVAPGRIHSWKLDPNARGWVIAFKAEMLSPSPELPPITSLPFFSYLTRKPLFLAPPSFIENLHLTFRSIYQEYHGAAPFREVALHARLSLLLVQCSRLFPQTTTAVPSAAFQTTHRFIQLLDESIPALKLVQDYAAKLHISSHRLIECVKECTGRTAGSLIEERLLTQSKRLLWFTDLTIAEIAYALDFKDPSHFGHFFKRQTGLSPGHARRLSAQSHPPADRCP